MGTGHSKRQVMRSITQAPSWACAPTPATGFPGCPRRQSTLSGLCHALYKLGIHQEMGRLHVPPIPRVNNITVNIKSDGTHSVPGRELGLSHENPTLVCPVRNACGHLWPHFTDETLRSQTLPVKNGSGSRVSNWKLCVSAWPAPAPSVAPSFRRDGFEGHSAGMFLSALPFMKHPDLPEVGGGRGTWLSVISSHSFLGSGLAEHGLWPLGSRWLPGADPTGTGCGVLFRQCPLSSSGRAGLRGRQPDWVSQGVCRELPPSL